MSSKQRSLFLDQILGSGHFTQVLLDLWSIEMDENVQELIWDVDKAVLSDFYESIVKIVIKIKCRTCNKSRSAEFDNPFRYFLDNETCLSNI